MSNRQTDPKWGICRLCGFEGRLSFEHVPPEKAFNNRGLLFSDINLAFGDSRDQVVNIERRRGLGAHTLCEKHNNWTGRVYAPSFIDWVKDSYQALKLGSHLPLISQWREFYPLRVLKQIATMVFSANSENFHKVHPELVNFVLNKKDNSLSPRYRFFLYFNHIGRKRLVGNAAMIDIPTQRPIYITEITFPPYGYVFCIDSTPSDSRLYEITHFSSYGYREKKRLNLEVPVLPTYTQYPGDYRTEKEVLSDAGFSPVLFGQQEIPYLL